MVDRYPGKRTEYGGGDGDPQRLPDGAAIDLPGIASAAGKRARLLRTAGMNDFDPARSDLVGLADTGLTGLKPENMSAAQLEAYEAALRKSAMRAEERRRIEERTNGYINEVDSYSGEEGS